MAPDRRRAVACGVLLALALAAAPASAALYTCTDASGRKFTADRPPPECANLPVRELRADGSVRRVIEPPPTEEQRKARAEQAQRALQEQEAKRSQARRDIALLETYAASADIEAARRAALVSRQATIDRSKQRLETLAAERKKLDNEAEFYANRKVPEMLERAIEANKALVQAEQRLIDETQADMARINKRFDVESERYRELVRAGARPQLLQTGEGASR